MLGLEWRTVLGGVMAASGLFVSMGAQAHDDDRWRWACGAGGFAGPPSLNLNFNIPSR
jgi:hypothetical protein